MARELLGLEVLETLKEGAIVHELRARQVPLGRTVRLLKLSPGILPASPLAAPLRRQAEVLGALDHPAIVQLHTLIDDGTDLVLVLEDVLSPSLADIATTPLSIPACVSLLSSVARALSYAQSKGHVHGRLSPECVRFTEDGRVKLEGFGAEAGALGREPIEPDGALGLAPETTIGQNPSHLSDIFCLGALIYQALTGTPPFGDPKDPKYPARVRNLGVVPLLKLRPETPPALLEIVERCLSKHPPERPNDAAQVLAALAAASLPAGDGAVVRDLVERGLSSRQLVEPHVERPRAARLRLPRWVGLALAAFVGAATLGLVLAVAEDSGSNIGSALSLSGLSDEDATLIRVVATPWAHVLVDGKHRETTPFAEPLRVTPGRHVIRLEHPQAPAEERVIEGNAGQAILLDVRMLVRRKLSAPEAIAPEEDDSP